MNFAKLLENKNLIIQILSIFIAILVVFLMIELIAPQKEIKTNIVPATKIAVINSQKLKSEALCFKAQKDLNSMWSDVLAKMRDEENKAKSEFAKVRNNKNMAKKEMAQSIEKIEENWSQTSTKLKEEIQNVENLGEKLSVMIQKKLDEVIKQISKTYRIDVVLNDEIKDTISVFYVNEHSDITGIVIQKLNKSIPNVDLEKLK